jgi:hypothetical protein
MPDPISIGISQPIAPSHAPWPRNEGERLLFAQLYEPLVRVDCTGRVVPGLAASWSSDPSRREWTFVLRPGAVFSRSGRAVTASAVIESWRASVAAHSGEPAGAIIATIASGARALDSSTLLVTVADSLPAPNIFAAAELVVANQMPGGGWPDGTTSYYVDSSTVEPRAAPAGPPAGTRAVALRSTSAAPPLLFRIDERRDARDVLDAGVDLLPTESSSAVQYAATQPDRTVLALPWSRTYVLALPSRAADVSAHPDCQLHPQDAGQFRAALALAVHAAVRGAEQPFWWVLPNQEAGAAASTGAASCRSPVSLEASGTARQPAASRRGALPLRRIVYPRDDSTARELAERIVALAAPGREGGSDAALASVAPELPGVEGWRAVALDSADFTRALAAGTEPAYVIALQRHPAAPTIASATLGAAAPWLGGPTRFAAGVVPLVDTRASLIARHARAPLLLATDQDGVLLFDTRPSPAAEPTR